MPPIMETLTRLRWLTAMVHLLLLQHCWSPADCQPQQLPLGEPSIDLATYWEQHPPTPTQPPTWDPPGGGSFQEFSSTYGLSQATFAQVKDLVAQIRIKTGESAATAYNNTGLVDDMMLVPPQLQAILGQSQGRKKRSLIINFATFPSNKWPTTTPIKYMFSGQHTTAQEDLIRQGFQFWEDNTCLSFQQVTSAPSGQYVLVQGNANCYAYVGRVATSYLRPQIINLSPTGCMIEGTIMHEIGHMIGKYHEQSRYDRDSFVTINLANVPTAKHLNFDKLPQSDADTYGTPYDFSSVMHYNAKAFAIDTSINTITPIGNMNNMYSIGMGQRTYPSFWDINGVNTAYCSATCTTSPACENSGYANPTSCSQCHCPEGFGGSLCSAVATGGTTCSPSSHAELAVAVDGTQGCIHSPGYTTATSHPQGTGTDCNFLLQVPDGCTIDIKFTYGPFVLGFTNGGCIHWVEVKYKSDLALPGPRFCSGFTPTSATGQEWLTTESNQALVIFNAEAPFLAASTFPDPSYNRPGFELCYKITDPTCATCQPQTCLNGGICTSTTTGPSCACVAGWSGADCGTDVNECLTSNGGCAHNCVNDVGSFHCTCNAGYTLATDGKACIDNNECATANGGCQHTCTNTAGSFVCSCNAGYTLAADGQTCTDINECLTSNGGCAQNCVNDPGTFHCTCNTGYQLATDGKACADINECTLNTDGCQHTCVNDVGSFHCTCNTGYTLAADGKACTDVNECLTSNGGCAHNCVNDPGTFHCTCNTGYQLASDGKACTDINECTLNTDGCQHTCVNDVGSFHCTCNTGYTLAADGKACTDLNECLTSNGGCAHNCVNDPGTFHCTCNTGFFLAADGKSCNIAAVPCDSQPCVNGGTCANVGTSFSCMCPTGYTGTQCQIDVNECLTSNGGCAQNCVNDVGTFHCTCNTGYQLATDGKACTDNNECVTANGGCQHTCTNTAGSFVCSCNAGYTLAADDKTCTDNNECATANGGCQHACTNTAGSFICSCNAGYTLAADGKTCTDNNECATANGGCQHTCTNTAGSFVCSCNAGYTLAADGKTCTAAGGCDPNPCLHGGTCAAGVCTCAVGYFGSTCAEGCGASVSSTWAAWGPCTLPCGGCGTQRRRRCDTATNRLRYQFRRCNICPCRRNIDPTSLSVRVRSYWTLRYRFVRLPMMCCNDFWGPNVRRPGRLPRPRPCFRYRVRGWYGYNYNRNAYCRASRPYNGFGTRWYIGRYWFIYANRIPPFV